MGSFAAAFPVECGTFHKGRAEKRPNVLFISIDDPNHWVGCLGGHPDTPTPDLDRLAGRGVLFTRAYWAAPLCKLPRAALLTGIRPAVSGVYFNLQPWRNGTVLKDALTLPFITRGAREHVPSAHGEIAAGRMKDKRRNREWTKAGSSPAVRTVPERTRGGRERPLYSWEGWSSKGP